MTKLVLLLLFCIGGFYLYEHFYGEKTVPPRLAPEGVVYTLERTSESSGEGIVGIPAGAKLKLIRKEGTESVVEYQEHTVSVPNTVLTRDLDVVAAIQKDEAKARAKAAADAAIQPSAPAATPNPKVKELNDQLTRIRDKKADIEWQIKRIKIELRGQVSSRKSVESDRDFDDKGRVKAETSAIQQLSQKLQDLTAEFQRLDADEGYVENLIQRESRP